MGHERTILPADPLLLRIFSLDVRDDRSVHGAAALDEGTPLPRAGDRQDADHAFIDFQAALANEWRTRMSGVRR